MMRRKQMIHRLTTTAAATLLASSWPMAAAVAHSGQGGGWSAGFVHPMTGADHVLAMVAVGLWAALRGGGAMVLWPAAFVAAMLTGFGLAPLNIAIPMLEPMIASSVILLGAAIALRLSAPMVAGSLVIALAGAAHGFAHGLEVQGEALPFAASFSVSTVLLHAAGIGLGMAMQRMADAWPTRAVGAAIAIAGVALLAA